MQRKVYSIGSVLFLLLLVAGSTVGALVSVKSSYPPAPMLAGESPIMHVAPSDVNGLNVGDTFTVTVSVSGIAGEDLYGVDINFTWDTNALRYVSHEVRAPAETHSGGILHQPIVQIMDRVGESVGSYWFAYASMLPAEPFNNDGAFFTITFVLLQQSGNPFSLEHVVLANNHGDVIFLSPNPNLEVPAPLPRPEGMSEARWLRNVKWLEWWTTVTSRN